MLRASDAAIEAATDRLRAFVDELATYAGEHLATCPKAAWDCPGNPVSVSLDVLGRSELQALAEIALVKVARLKASNADTFIYEPSFHCWIPNRPDEDPDDHEHDSSIPCDWGWMCNGDGCTVRTDDVPCPEHAPTDIPQLRLTECMSVPLHWVWVHRNDDYGQGCPMCEVARLLEEIGPLREAQRLRVHRWCWLTNRARGFLVWLRLMRVSSWSSDCRYRMHHVSARWRWARR